MNLEQGMQRWIFSDYQYETKVIGKVKLLEFIREGLTFILEDMPKETQVVFGTQYWRCEILSDGGYYPKGYIKTFPIKYINNIGPITSKQQFDEDEDITEEQYLENQLIIDKFIEVDGEQIF